MPYQVSRTDTGQFVLTDPSTDTVIIDDDLAAGFSKLEQTVADKPPRPSADAPAPSATGADLATQGSSAFSFKGGPRYTPVLLAGVLPFAWLVVLYFALANLLSEHALDRGAAEETQAKVEELERELQSLRTEVSGAPRAPKTKATKRSGAAQPTSVKPAAVKPKPAPPATANSDAGEPDAGEPDAQQGVE